MKIRISLLISAVLAICAVFCLFSCDAYFGEGAVGIASSSINERGELMDAEPDFEPESEPSGFDDIDMDELVLESGGFASGDPEEEF